tara:strand:- start:225 stop:935 length:711 start_codon:yes stop_codon:yes gene_type:complete
MRTLDLTDDDRLAGVSETLVADPPETLVLQTGMGTTMWLEAMDGIGVGGDLRAVLATVEVLARGPKASSAARRAGMTVAWQAPREIFADVVDHIAATGGRRRLAVQLDGTDEELLVGPLAASCPEVLPIPVYRWGLPDDRDPARALVDAVCGGGVQAVTFTTRTAAVHLAAIAEEMGRLDEMVSALDGKRVVPVSVGPVCSSAMLKLGMCGLVEPDRARLVAMVDALCDRVSVPGG